MFLARASTPTVDDLLMGIMNVSANDGAVVLAEGAAGSVAGWTAKMNEAARRLGMTHSHFNTPNGYMDNGQTYVSARDLVKLADAMISRYPAYFHHYVGRPGLTWNGITQPNHDPTLGVVPGADGIKTGYTGEAHYNFLGTAQRGGRRLLMVLAGVEKPRDRTKAARALLEWGFSAWDAKPLLAGGTRLGEAQVQGGTAETCRWSPRAISCDAAQGRRARPSMRIVYNGRWWPPSPRARRWPNWKCAPMVRRRPPAAGGGRGCGQGRHGG
jgi:D-alanyl-D-alanine carboxypeptidase (penicillin-binding protein 5/6)